MTHTPGPRRLSAIVFLSGAIVLALELVCPRFLAPAFGAGHSVWSAVIASTLAALAAGYALGGRWADGPRPGMALAGCLAGAAAWALLLPWVRHLFVGWTLPLGPVSGPYIASILLMGPPLVLLGAVAPIAVRAGALDLGHVGRSAGRVAALSTAGSIAGALLTGVVLIPWMPGSDLVSGIGVALLALAVLAAIPARRAAAAAVTIVAALAAAVYTQHERATETPDPLTPATGVRFARNSRFANIVVQDLIEPPRRALILDGLTHTIVSLPELENLSEVYTAFGLTTCMRPHAESALVIGLGGGVTPRALARQGIRTDVVEIDPVVVDVARTWFGFESLGEVHVADGRTFLRRSTNRYDLIFLDAASGDSHPFHLFTVEAYEDCLSRLTDGGLLSINLVGSATDPRGRTLVASVLRTLGAVFQHAAVLQTDTRAARGAPCENLLFLASNSPLEYRTPPRTAAPELAAYYSRIAQRPLLFELRDGDRTVVGPMFTDDHCPIDDLSSSLVLAHRGWVLASNASAGWAEVMERIHGSD
ncbi:MAG: hypothetical protein GC161_18595 [Planctomycetaceae bacterium]|nr:hypothetical protein [Planctomycetaceae bacterium]